MPYYLDSSALLKLFLEESSSTAMRLWFTRNVDQIIASELTRLEVIRTVRRFVPEMIPAALFTFTVIERLAISVDVFERAGLLEPATLRSLDALHLATALSLGPDLDGLVTYDDRLADAARVAGVQVLIPA